nr:glutathione S-transferase domain-containing protein [Limobrevibacterium gyesilva]
MVYGLYVELIDRPARGQATDRAVVAQALPQTERCLAALADLMGAAPFLAGPRLTLADTHAAPMFALLRWPAPGAALLARFAPLLAWWRAMAARPAMIATRFPGEPAEGCDS